MPALVLLVVVGGVAIWFFISTRFASKIGNFMCDMWSKIVGNEDKLNNKKEGLEDGEDR